MGKIFAKIVSFAIIPMLLSLMAGCIENDLPYPRIPQLITAIEARGELKPADIDSVNYIATVYLNEKVDIERVSFKKFETTPGAESDVDLLEGTYNLTRPEIIVLSKYQDYQWLIVAEQTIERYLTIEGQIGETVINEATHRIVVQMPESADLSDLKLTSIKLGPADITELTPEITPGTINLQKPLRVAVYCHGRTEYWQISAVRTSMLANTTRVDAWSQVIWAYGEGVADEDNGFEYKEDGGSEWIKVDKSFVTDNGGSFHCYIPHLKPLTSYVVRAYSGSNIGNEIKVTTESTADIPDGDFDQWWLNGKVWCPWAEGAEPYWDTGNTGAATLGQSNVLPSDFTPDGSGKAAELNTRFVGIAGIGKLAAGSIYTGKFAKIDGTNGILDFGRKWNLRPTRLRGYYCYKTAPINYTSAEYKYLEGRPDSCHIYVALTDWTAPFEIRTNPKNRQLFDSSSPSVIAYGELISGDSMDGYQEFVIELKYRDTSRVPSYLLITNAASKYGDFFTGGTGATLYVDQYSFDYDY